MDTHPAVGQCAAIARILPSGETILVLYPRIFPFSSTPPPPPLQRTLILYEIYSQKTNPHIRSIGSRSSGICRTPSPQLHGAH